MQKIQCIAKTAKGTMCPNFGKNPQNSFSGKFCKVHHYQASLTNEEWNKMTLCHGCISWKLKSEGNLQCDNCIETASKKRKSNLETKNSNRIHCSGVCRGNASCNRKVDSIGMFCNRHMFQSSYDKEELENMQECLGCRLMYSVKSFNGNKSCGSCKGRKKSMVVTNKKSEKGLGACVMTTLSKQKCQNSGAIDINGQLFCKFHSSMVKEQNELAKLGKKKCSSSYACGSLVELNGKYNTCEKCRKSDRAKSGSKSTSRKVIIVDDNKNEEKLDTSEMPEDLTDSIEEVKSIIKKDTIIDSAMEREREKLMIAKKKSDELSLLEKFIGDNGLDKKVENNKTDILNKIVAKHNSKFYDDIDSDDSDDSDNSSIESIDEKKELEGVDLSKCKLSACTKCGKEFNTFLNKLGKLSFKCEYCLNMQRKVEAGRGTRKRDWKGELDRNPNRKAKKDKWKDENADKVAMYDVAHKTKKLETIGIDKVREIRNKTATEWRKNNPDKVHSSNLKSKGNPQERLNSIKYTAKDKGINFNISDNYAIKIISSRCIYCNGKNKDSVNGIDRIDSSKGYIYDNIVSCCSHCNVCIKNTTDIITMLCKIEHILHHNKIIDNGSYQWEYCLNSTTKKSFGNYINSAHNRKKDFTLTWNEIQQIIKNPCYICGKNYEDGIHYNGIDRFDNTIGYIPENSRSCCGHCNIIKGSVGYNYLLQKLEKIYDRKNTILCIIKITEENEKFYDMNQGKRDTQLRKYQKNINNITNYYKNNKVDKFRVNYKRNKPTKEEKLKDQNDTKKRSDDKLKQKYGDKEYLRLRSLRNGLSRNRAELNGIKDSTESVHVKRVKVLNDSINRMLNEINIIGST